jgi:gliding motility-associated-like protein
LPSNLFHVDWYFDSELVGSGTTYFATETGIYTAVPSKLIPEVAPNCNYAPATVEVFASSAAIAIVEVTQPFEDIANASVIIQHGIGEYMYQLDNGDFQSSPEFHNISQGLHTITVRDILGNCSDFKIEFRVLKYPKFFTPNNDGSNDTWNIWDLRKSQPNATISIYDKYGKFLTQISPKSYGWDGTFNGNPLPSSDYWFIIEFIDDNQTQQFKAHFSLKR